MASWSQQVHQIASSLWAQHVREEHGFKLLLVVLHTLSAGVVHPPRYQCPLKWVELTERTDGVEM